MKLHTHNGGRRIDFSDSEISDTPLYTSHQPYGLATLLLAIVLFSLCGMAGWFLWPLLRMLPAVWR